MNGLQSALKHACEQLGLEVKFDRVFKLNEHSHIEAPAHIMNVGAPMGMLIFSDVAAVWPFVDSIRSARYGFSVLENRPLDGAIDIDSFKMLFNDWGWSGDKSLKPSWFR